MFAAIHDPIRSSTPLSFTLFVINVGLWAPMISDRMMQNVLPCHAPSDRCTIERNNALTKHRANAQADLPAAHSRYKRVEESRSPVAQFQIPFDSVQSPEAGASP